MKLALYSKRQVWVGQGENGARLFPKEESEQTHGTLEVCMAFSESRAPSEENAGAVPGWADLDRKSVKL